MTDGGCCCAHTADDAARVTTRMMKGNPDKKVFCLDSFCQHSAFHDQDHDDADANDDGHHDNDDADDDNIGDDHDDADDDEEGYAEDDAEDVADAEEEAGQGVLLFAGDDAEDEDDAEGNPIQTRRSFVWLRFADENAG